MKVACTLAFWAALALFTLDAARSRRTSPVRIDAVP